MAVTFSSLKPQKTWASAEGARNAVRKKYEGEDVPDQADQFRVLIVADADGRWYPIIYNIKPDALAYMIHSGFIVVN